MYTATNNESQLVCVSDSSDNGDGLSAYTICRQNVDQTPLAKGFNTGRLSLYLFALNQPTTAVQSILSSR